MRVEGLMSHFASAADFTSPQTDDQIGRFNEIIAESGRAGHPAAADALRQHQRDRLRKARRVAAAGAARPCHLRLCLAGARPCAAPSALRVQPALVVESPNHCRERCAGGRACRLWRTFVAQLAMRIAVLAAGYADGIPHRLSNKGKVIAGGRFAPIVGTVSMDLTTIDITASPHLTPGDAVTLLGREGDVSLDAQQIARTAGTISYNVLCGISARVKRCYVD